ncbi:expressed unknown protein [Seminavis robusta]|uniref:Uncharacterized protein n=1 Tax=Seminavis robusta TaxID=568900 RepID=A0A9N8EE50_9STRA|nr:expressed unknown protein [Seminavis robusta]|eukprot:Sro944_g222920.1 n/a (265) ;mRNA; r:15274-16068
MPPGEEECHKNGTSNPETGSKWINDFELLTMDEYLDQPDLVDSHGDASFTGVWDAAKELAEYLLTNTKTNTNTNTNTNIGSPTRILELGSGTGWLGITLARNGFGNNKSKDTSIIVLSDNPHNGAVQWTQRNLDAAKTVQQLPHLDNVQVVPLDWNDVAQIRHVAKMQPWDLIIGSDLIYTEEGCCALAKTMAELLNQQQQQSTTNNKCRILYAHSQGRMPELDVLWKQQLQLQGLTFQIVASKPQSWQNKDRTIIIGDIGLVS